MKVVALKRGEKLLLHEIHFNKRKFPQKSQVFIFETLIEKLPKNVAFFMKLHSHCF